MLNTQKILETSLDKTDFCHLQLPELPSILGSHRGSAQPSIPDANERLDFLVKGETQSKDILGSPEGEEEPVDFVPEEVMRSNLEPLINTLFEEDEFFLRDFEGEGLDRILFIRKMGVYVEIKTKEYLPGIFCTSLFHCLRCKDHWMKFGIVAQNCQHARQPTRGPAIHLVSNREPRVGARERRKAKRLGDIKEGFVVSGSGTVLSEFAEEEFQDGKTDYLGAHSILATLGSRDHLPSDDVNMEDLGLSQIDLSTIIEAFKYEGDPQHFDKEAYVTNLAEALGLNPIQLYKTFEEVVSAKQARVVTYVKDIAMALGVDLTTMTEAVKKLSEVEAFKKETFAKTVEEEVGINSAKILQAFEEVVNTKKTRIETFTQDMAASLGVNLTTVTEALRKVTHEEGNIDRETLARSLAAEMGFDSTTILEALGDSKVRFSSAKDPVLDKEGLDKLETAGDLSTHEETTISVQKKFRSRKKNKSVKNRPGHHDTANVTLGQPIISLPSNSSSFSSSYNADGAEEHWGRMQAPRLGSSSAQLSASRTSMYTSDTASAPHVTDSRDSILAKYSSAIGSAHARKDMPSSNLQDRVSHGSFGGSDNLYDFDEGDTGKGPNRARRIMRKKEKGENPKKPKHHHSRVIEDMSVGHENKSSTHLTSTFGLHARPSQVRSSRASLSLSNANSAVSCGSIVLSKRSSRPTSSIMVTEHAQNRKATPEPLEVEGAREEIDKLPELITAEDTTVPVDSDSTSATQEHQAESQSNESIEELFANPHREKSKLSIEDFKVLQRLPLSSAFTFSFFQIPRQHRLHNERIRKAANRIGRPKKPSSNFRSKTAP